MANPFLNKIVNPINICLLRSAWHELLSQSTMLITVRGRVTGTEYTFPVGYVLRDGAITVFSPRTRRWWMNLRGGAPVTIVLRGQELHATAELVPANHDFMVSAIRDAYPRASASRAERMADETVMIRVCPDVELPVPVHISR